MSDDLWVLACALCRSPLSFMNLASFATLRSKASRSTRRQGVSMSSTGMPTVAGILMVMSLLLSDCQATAFANRGSMSRSSLPPVRQCHGNASVACLVRSREKLIVRLLKSARTVNCSARDGAVEGKPRLSFAHHMQHLAAGEHVGGAGRGLEAEHGPDAPLDARAMSASTTRLAQRHGSIRADTARAWRAHALIAKRAIDLQRSNCCWALPALNLRQLPREGQDPR